MDIYTIAESLKAIKNNIDDIKGLVTVDTGLNAFGSAPCIHLTEEFYFEEFQNREEDNRCSWTDKYDSIYRRINGVAYFCLVDKEVK